jgi:hypothetical protein
MLWQNAELLNVKAGDARAYLPFWLQDFISFRKSAAFQICRLA